MSNKNIDKVYRLAQATYEAHPSDEVGLSTTNAKLILERDGKNDLQILEYRDFWRVIGEALREPMFLLLVIAGGVYLMLGDVTDALLLLGFIIIVLSITIYQENKTERVLQALRELTSPRALVLRDGVEQRIAGSELVSGDLLILNEGDRVSGDAILLSSHNLFVDESLLTGESAIVSKCVDPILNISTFKALPDPGGDGTPFLYSGSLVAQGKAKARVIATGQQSKIGKIGKSLQDLRGEPTPLQGEIKRLVIQLAILGGAMSGFLTLMHGITRGDWLHGVLAGITLAISIMPEEYPMVFTVFMAMGAWRISQHQVLTRRLNSIETLGSATVLCVDKTGTLTLNRMQVKQLMKMDATFSCDEQSPTLPEPFHELAEYAILACENLPSDPMERAIHALGHQYLINTEHLHPAWHVAQEYALSPELLALSRVWKAPGKEAYIVAAKGAPEAIADLCHMDANDLSKLIERVNQAAAHGMRVIGVAKASFSGACWPLGQHDFAFQFVGLVALIDPFRPMVPQALQECKQAGIRVIMITGDYPATAAALGSQIGLGSGNDDVITGGALAQMDDSTVADVVGQRHIFARMTPEQKLRLVQVLKANGEIVAMTGDGVNDAPALKAAHIGIAMGGRGTDVAREAASLVLLDDDFVSIVRAIQLGRRIYDNLRKAMAYIFAVHLPIIGLSLLPLLFGWPQLLGPVHIVFLEMIVNPACSIAFEAEPPEQLLMQRPPRSNHEPLFSRRVFLISLMQGFCVLLFTLVLVNGLLQQGTAEALTRTLTFTTLVVANVGLILVNRSWSKSVIETLNISNNALWWLVGFALMCLLLTLNTPLLREVFDFAPMTPYQMMTSTVVGLVSVIWFEGYKLYRRWVA